MPYIKTHVGGTPEWVDELPSSPPTEEVTSPTDEPTPPPPQSFSSHSTPKPTSQEEAPANFNKQHYGTNGLNGKFNSEGAINLFAGGTSGGGGKFEDPNLR